MGDDGRVGKAKWTDLTLRHDATGREFPMQARFKPSGGPPFMKLWQDVGWDEGLLALRGEGARMLLYLARRAGWENVVPGPSDTARVLKMKQQAVSRAYVELKQHGFLLEAGGEYRLNPLFCWKGSDEQFAQILDRLAPGGKELLLPQGMKR